MTTDPFILNAREVVLSARTGAEALKALYELKKAANPRFSLTHLCKAAGVTSKGYLSDVMSGRRKLNPKYGDGIAKAFGFEGAYSETLALLFGRDDTEDEAERQRLDGRLAALKKSLKSSSERLPQKLRGMFFAFEVFAAFGLFKNRPTRQDLRGYFGPGCGVELEYALHVLATMELVRAVEGEEERFELVTEAIRFDDSEDGISHMTWTELAIQDARESVKHWFGKRDKAFFDANIISVKRKDLAERLKRIREEIRKMQTDLESGDADLLIRFNVQIYPSRE